MRNVPSWKTVIKYVTGMLVLAVSIALALFLPEWYAQWQDEKLDGQVTLAHREQITFLDTTSLDIAGKIKVVTEASDLNWNNTLWEYDPAYYQDDLVKENLVVMEQFLGMPPDEMIQKSHNLMEKWCDAGLLPDFCGALVQMENLGYMGAHLADAEDQMLTLIVMGFYDEQDTVLLITDQDVEIIYYGCSFGAKTMEFMAQEMGYASVAAISKEALAGNTTAKRITAPEEFELEDFCGAESVTVTGNEDELDFAARLFYTNFESIARRCVILTDEGFGLSMLFGSYHIEMFLTQLLDMFGSVLMQTNTKNFLDVCSVETEVVTEAANEAYWDKG